MSAMVHEFKGTKLSSVALKSDKVQIICILMIMMKMMMIVTMFFCSAAKPVW